MRPIDKNIVLEYNIFGNSDVSPAHTVGREKRKGRRVVGAVAQP
jgi:hypothetical protein